MGDDDGTPESTGAQQKRQLRHYFVRPDYDPTQRPSRTDLAGATRLDRRLVKKQWQREHGGRFHTWVYVAALVLIIAVWALLVFH